MSYKRMKIAIVSGIVLTGLTVYAISAGMENLALACIGGITAIVTFFIGGDSFRKSI